MNQYQIDFINTLAPLAIEDSMITGIPACITIAQGITESAWGRSKLTIEGNNLFGIKGSGGGQYQTKEQLADGTWVTITAGFRHYATWYDCVKDHSSVLLNTRFPNGTYRYRSMVGEKDYKIAANVLVTGGYATDQQYANNLIGFIQDYSLEQYNTDSIKGDNGMAQNTKFVDRDFFSGQDALLVDSLNIAYKKGIINDYHWVDLASKGELTDREVALLGVVCGMRLAKDLPDVR